MKKAVLGLLLSVITMLVIGIVMLFSTGAFAQDAHGDPIYFVKRQAMWIAVGIVGCCVAACVDYHYWERTWKYWFAVAVVLLVLCFVPHICHKINGSRRWIKLGPLCFQPSEVGKIAAITFLAAWFSQRTEQAKRFMEGFVTPLAAVGVIILLIAAEVDLGTAATIGGMAFLVMFVAGTNLAFIVPIAVSGIGGVLAIGYLIPQRLGRILAFLDLEKYKDGAGLQQYQGLIALGSGGVDGLGLGNGREKMLFLPFAHTDFIFPMVGEELGLKFTLLIVFCYVLMIICGAAIAINSRDRFGMLFGFGFVVIIALQAAMNIGVTTAMMPNKGIPLPFISYGGSNLAFCLLGIGILLNIYRQGLNEQVVKKVTLLKCRTTPRM